jgi:2-oxoisovalerate dehydrogenase E1 component
MDTLLDIYKRMYLIRRAEEKIAELTAEHKIGLDVSLPETQEAWKRVWKMSAEKKITPLVHLSIGQEGAAAGMAAALTDNDYAWSGHRCHAHYLAKGGDLKAMFAELAGKATGCARGWGGSMHLVDPDVNMLGTSAIVGGAVPLAAGAALASKLRKDGRVSVAFLGDGATEQGVFWETLNFAVVHKLPLIFFCENNLYATHSHLSKRQPSLDIAERVTPFISAASIVDGNDALAVFEKAKEAVERARNGEGPSFIEVKTYRLKEHWGPEEDWHLGYRSKEEGDLWKERCPLPLMRTELEGRGLNSELKQIEERVEKDIKEAWEFAENSSYPDWDDFNSVFENNSTVNSEGERQSSSGDRKMMKYNEAIAEAHLQIMEDDPNVFIIGEGCDNIGGVYGTTLPAYKKFGPERVIDTSLCDAALTGIGIGAAIAGMRPIVSHQRTNFMYLATDQIINNASVWKYMTGGRIKVPVTIRAWNTRKPYEASQHSHAPQSIFAHFPGLKVVMPSCACDAKGLTIAAVKDDDPVLIFDSWLNMMEAQEIPREMYEVAIGKAAVLKEGHDVTIVAFSSTVGDALLAADILSQNSVSAEVIDLRSARPIDRECLIKSVRKTGRIVAVDPSWTLCGVSAEVLAIVSETAGLKNISAKRLGIADAHCPASHFLLTKYHPTAEDIARTSLEIFNELNEPSTEPDLKIKTLEELALLAKKLKSEGKKIILSHGAYDLIHAGHIHHLKEGAKQGDVLMVSITPDKFIKKGPDRPRFNENERAKFLADLKCVDFVCVNNASDATDVIETLQPDIYLKGEDVKDKADNPAENLYREIQLVRQYNGDVCFIESLPIHSTDLINKFFDNNE